MPEMAPNETTQIALMESEIAALRHDIERHLLIISELLHQNEKMTQALRPFADQAATHGPQIPDEMFVDDYADGDGPWKSKAQIRVGDLRRARAALGE